MKPYYSVIIPTFNRAHLLPLAIESVLAQTFGDFEMIISNGGSTDNTRDVVQSFGDARIKYVESNERLAVGDNYQQGLDNATGEYFTFLSDDDAYTPVLLDRVRKLTESEGAKIVGYPYCRYYHDELYDFERNVPRNSLLIHKYDGVVTEFSSATAIEQIFIHAGLRDAKADPKFVVPYLSNAVYHRSVFDQIKLVRKKVFDFVPPDMYLAAAVFYVVERYHCLDMPLLVWSNWEGNATASATREQDRLKHHYVNLMEGRQMTHTPLKFALGFNCGAESVLTAAAELGQERQPEADWAKYFITTLENFIFLRSCGVELSDEMAEFENVLATQPEHVRLKVQEARTQFDFRARQFLNVHYPQLAASIRRLRRGPSSEPFTIVRGDDSGFSNVAEAARAALPA